MSVYVPTEGALGAVKTGFDIIKGVLELLKKDKVDRAEVNGQLVQLQERLLDARNAVIDAKSYIEKLEAEKARRNRIDELEVLMVYDQSVYWKRTGSGDEVEPDPYCTVCWEKERRLSHLRPGATKGLYSCQIDLTDYQTNNYNPYPVQSLARRRRRW